MKMIKFHFLHGLSILVLLLSLFELKVLVLAITIVEEVGLVFLHLSDLLFVLVFLMAEGGFDFVVLFFHLNFEVLLSLAPVVHQGLPHEHDLS